MATHTNLQNLFTAIADSIRAKTGKAGTIVADTFPTEIAGIVTLPDTEQATPSITVSSAGLITASATQSAGYVAAGTKSATKQLTTQAAKTVTPSTSNQTAVASGVYTTGAVTVKGDANLIASNIASGKSIFGVAGTNTEAPVLLWTNASPKSRFGEQTVSVAEGYDGYLIECIANYAVSNNQVFFLDIGLTRVFSFVGSNFEDTSGSHHNRAFTAYTSSIEISQGRRQNSDHYQLNSIDNSIIIPTRIWGVKWTL